MVIFFWSWRCAITQQTTATEPTNQAPEMFGGMRNHPKNILFEVQELFCDLASSGCLRSILMNINVFRHIIYIIKPQLDKLLRGFKPTNIGNQN